MNRLILTNLLTCCHFDVGRDDHRKGGRDCKQAGFEPGVNYLVLQVDEVGGLAEMSL